MSIKSDLEELFVKWENSDSIYKNKFYKDGIFDGTEYLNTSPKILFLLKESNDPGQNPGDLTVDIKYELLEKKSSKSFVYRMYEWVFGIFNNFSTLNYNYTREEVYNTLKKVSLMNIKKIEGKNKSNINKLFKYAEKDKEFIIKEIEILNPEIIISGFDDLEILNKIFGDIEFKDSGYCRNIGKFRNCKIIDFFHPSTRISCIFTYCLLGKIINSQTFKDL